jgi:EAL and modified HD-GYP domain-containing signal transduction protein
MPSDNNLDPATLLPRVEDFFLARQPIMNRDQALIAYELLFRRASATLADVTDDLSATASVIAHATELGMENVIGALLGFLNIDATVLMSDFVKFLPPQKVVLELLETVEITPAVVARVADLRKSGYRFALDDVVAFTPAIAQMLPHISIVKIDIAGMARATIADLFRRFKAEGKSLLAEKIETLDEYNYCHTLGFDYFQGYYFSKPVIMTGKKLAPSQMVIVRMMAQLDADVDTIELERSIKRDAALGLTLLRLVNTPAVGVIQRIESLKQALNVLGRRQLYRWLQIMLYAEVDKGRHVISPLLLMATSRGKLLELLMQKLYPGSSSRSDLAFTVGIMSLMDTLFGLQMEEILHQMPVAAEVRSALLEREGLLGDMLRLVECTESSPECTPLLVEVLEKLNLSSDDLYEVQAVAYEWSNSIAINT